MEIFVVPSHTYLIVRFGLVMSDELANLRLSDCSIP